MLVMYDDPLTTKWCKKHKDIEGRNDCMDDKQCLENARRECDKNPDCFGVMWYSHLKRQPLQICLSRELEPKTDGWRTMLKSEGNQINFWNVIMLILKVEYVLESSALELT